MINKKYEINASDIQKKGTLGNKRVRMAQIATALAITAFFGADIYAPAMSIEQHEKAFGASFDYYETPLELANGDFITPITGLVNGSAIMCHLNNDGSAIVTFC